MLGVGKDGPSTSPPVVPSSVVLAVSSPVVSAPVVASAPVVSSPVSALVSALDPDVVASPAVAVMVVAFVGSGASVLPSPWVVGSGLPPGFPAYCALP